MTTFRSTPRFSSVLPRLFEVGFGALLAGPLHAALSEPHRPPPSSIVDGVTGIPIPQAVPGICVARFSDRAVRVQRSQDGLLIAGLATNPTTSTPAGDGTRFPNIHEAGARVIPCPASLLDFVSGCVSPTCLTAANPREPGPGALGASGTVRASLRVDESGPDALPRHRSRHRHREVLRSRAPRPCEFPADSPNKRPFRFSHEQPRLSSVREGAYVNAGPRPKNVEIILPRGAGEERFPAKGPATTFGSEANEELPPLRASASAITTSRQRGSPGAPGSFVRSSTARARAVFGMAFRIASQEKGRWSRTSTTCS